MNLYDYAVSGAVCSNAITPRFFSAIDAPFPAVKEYEVPAFIADSHYVDRKTHKPALDIPSSQTVYAIWIGTNDLGNYAFLTDSQVKGKTLVDYVNCVYGAIDSLYRNGARNFVIMNVAPLQLLPQYAVPEAGGRPATQYWPDKKGNLTEISYRIWENVVTVNDIYAYKTPYELKVAHRYPGAEIALFDTYSLVRITAAHLPSAPTNRNLLDLRHVLPPVEVSERYCSTQRHGLCPRLQHFRKQLRFVQQP
jgi:hypothetical protein